MRDTPYARVGQILSDSLFEESMRIEMVHTDGSETAVLGLVGTKSERFRSVTLSANDFDTLTIRDVSFTFNGDGGLLRLGSQAYSPV